LWPDNAEPTPRLRRLHNVWRPAACARRYYGSSEINLVLGLGPGADGARADVPWRADRHCKLGNVVAVRCLQNEQKVGFPGVRKTCLISTSSFFASACGLSTLGRVFNRSDSLVGPSPRHYECRHGSSPLLKCKISLFYAPSQGRDQEDVKDAVRSARRTTFPRSHPLLHFPTL
jgi:hypothetical protein